MIFEYDVNKDWYKGVYIDKDSPVKAGRPFSLIHRDVKSNVAVLCIHGYMGYPGELVRPSVDLYKLGFDIYVPRLPGHGTSASDFLKSNEEDWVGVALNAARDLAGKYESLYVLGHSMGGAIATVVAAEIKEVKRLVLASPAFVSDKKQLPANPILVKLLSIFRKRIRKEWKPDPAYVMYYEGAPADDLYLGHEYWSWIFPRKLCSLFELMLYAGGKELEKISCPTLIICSKSDNVVGTAPADLASEKIGKNAKILILDNASHYLFYDKDKKEEEKAVKAVIDFLS